MKLGNTDRNNYVREQIEKAAIQLLSEKELHNISINEIVERAGVSRVSFYRNYKDKEDIIKSHIAGIILKWHGQNAKRFDEEKAKTGNDNAMLSSLFGLLKDHEDLFLLLKKRNLFYLFKDSFLELYGPKSEYPNAAAYISAFFMTGIIGWIEEWVDRGMQESESEMMALLSQIK